jgi:2-dehydropantoate 2-reductase
VRYLVFGTGAVGGLMGARLALAGNQVTFLARPHITKVLQKDGLRLVEASQSRQVQDVKSSTEIKQALELGKPDIILLCVKAYDCSEAADIIKHALEQPVTVLSLLNGINNEQTLARILGPEYVIHGSLTTAVQMTRPGVVEVARRRGLGIAGHHPLAADLVGDLAAAGFRVEHYRNPDRMKWSKLLTNIVSNATSAITGLDPGRVFAHPGLAGLELDAQRETVRVMHQLGFSPQNLPGVSVAILGRAVFLPKFLTRRILGSIVASGRGQKKPSLHYDIGRGKSEVDWLNGAVARYGAQLGVATPVNEALTRTMKALVDDASLHSAFLGKPEALLARVYPDRA